MPRASTKDTIRLLRPYVRRRRKWVLRAVPLLLVAGVATLAGPYAGGLVVDVVLSTSARSSLIIAVVILLLAAALGGVGTWLGGRYLANFAQKVLASLREDVTETALTLPAEVVEDNDLGDLVSRISSDTARVSEAAESALGEVVLCAVQILVALIGLAFLDYRFTLAALLATPIQAFALSRYLRRSTTVYAEERIAEGELSSHIRSGYSALPTLSAFAVFSRFAAMICGRSLATRSLGIEANRIATRFFARLNAGEFVGLGAIVAVGYWLVSTGQITVGSAAAAALLFAALFNPINVVLVLFDVIQQAGASLTRLCGVLVAGEDSNGGDTKSEDEALLDAHLSAAQRRRTYAALELEGIVVEYRTGVPSLVIDSLALGRGTITAVVGASGAGKSTLGAVVAGTRDASVGSVRLFGSALADFDADELRQRVATVTQESYVFDASVFENLSLAKPTVSGEQLENALSELGALDWVQRLPQGLHTRVGSLGHPLSPAQVQHLALVRLRLLDPNIVVLDEATAQDSPLSRTLERATSALIKGKTCVLIAHRLYQAQRADRVLVLHEGRIVQDGAHDELMRQPGRYRDLYNLQRNGGLAE